MQTKSRLVLSLATCLISLSILGPKTANAETKTLYVPFTAVVSDYCYASTAVSNELDAQSACTVQQETVTIGEDANAVQQYSETESYLAEPSETEIVQVTTVVR